MITPTMTSALEEGRTKRLLALEMVELRVLEISPSLEVEGTTKEKKLKGMEKDFSFRGGFEEEVEGGSLCSKSLRYVL